jgi:hypothetical protein
VVLNQTKPNQTKPKIKLKKREYSTLNSLFFGRKKIVDFILFYFILFFKKGFKSPQFCLPYDDDDDDDGVASNFILSYF